MEINEIAVKVEFETSLRIGLIDGDVTMYLSSNYGEIEEVKSITKLITDELEEMEDLSDYADADEFETEWIDETIKLLSDYKKRVLEFKGEYNDWN